MLNKAAKNTGETVREQGMFYKAIMKLVLLYGSKSWVVMGSQPLGSTTRSPRRGRVR